MIDSMPGRWHAWLASIPSLLSPVRHRSAEAQVHLTVIRARAALVGARTALVNAARGLARSYGERLRKSGTQQVRRDLAAGLSVELRAALEPLFEEIESLSQRIAAYDRQIEQIAKKEYPEVRLLQQMKGVGTLIALTYVLTVEDPHRFRRSRDAWDVIWGCVPGAGIRAAANPTSARKVTDTCEP
jgi:transposase